MVLVGLVGSRAGRLAVVVVAGGRQVVVFVVVDNRQVVVVGSAVGRWVGCCLGLLVVAGRFGCCRWCGVRHFCLVCSVGLGGSCLRVLPS